MIGLADGFKLGYSTVREAQEAEYRRQLQDEQMQWAREDRAYRDSERKRVSDARSALENTISGMDTSSQRDIAAAGYTPDQIATGIAAQGGAKQFAEQAARYQNDFDSSDLADSGAAARAAQGLPIKGPGVNPATVKAPRKSELAGARARYALAMGQDPGAALADQEKAQGEERMKDWFAQFSHLSPKGLLEHPMLAGMLNGNPAVRGAVGLAKDGKTFIVADYNGSGTAEEFSRDELMQAAYQKFLESEGRVPESIALGLGRTDRKRARNREDVQDANKGQELAYGMNMGNRRFDLSEREFVANNAYRNRALGLHEREVGARVSAAERANWQPEQYVDDQGNVRIYDVNRTGKTPDFRERTMPAGLKPYRPSPELKVNQDGSVQRGGMLFTPDPKKPGAFIAAQFPGESALDKALQGDKGSSMAGMRRITQADLELAAIDPGRLQRTAKRGFFGGLTYVYKDPATGKEYSADEFDAIQQAPR